jgi:hypothetical protein
VTGDSAAELAARRHRRRAHGFLALSVVSFATTISVGALVRNRLGITYTGTREVFGFGPPQAARYAVAAMTGCVLLIVWREGGSKAFLPRRGQRRHFLIWLVIPQVLASGFLYQAYTYGDPAIAAGLLFASAFISLAHTQWRGESRPLTRGETLMVTALVALYLAGMLIFIVGKHEASASVASDEIGWAVFWSLSAAVALVVYVSNVGHPYEDKRGAPLTARRKAIGVSGMVALCSLVVAVPALVAPGRTSPTEWGARWIPWESIWPLLLFGLATYLANEFMFLAARKQRPGDVTEREPTTKPIRNAALTAEPLIVILLAIIPVFRYQIPSHWSDRIVQGLACTLMVAGSMGAALLLNRGPRPENASESRDTRLAQGGTGTPAATDC